jgi:hypothetical protein
MVSGAKEVAQADSGEYDAIDKQYRRRQEGIRFGAVFFAIVLVFIFAKTFY